MGSSLEAPVAGRNTDDEFEFAALLVLGEPAAGEAALRAYGQEIAFDAVRGQVEAIQDGVALLELGGASAHQTQRHRRAFGHMLERRETAAGVVVDLDHETVD